MANWIDAFWGLPAPRTSRASIALVIDRRTGGDADGVLAAVRERPQVEVVDSAHGLSHAIDRIDAERIVIARPGMRLAPSALEWLASSPAAVTYGDHVLDPGGGQVDLGLNPAWSPRLHARYDYVGGVFAADRALLRGALTRSESFDLPGLFGRLAQVASEIGHLPIPLWRGTQQDPVHPGQPGLLSPTRHSVKAVMPTRDRPDLLERAAVGILEATNGVDLHLVIVDNGTVDERARRLLRDLSRRSDVTILSMDEPFNFSRLVNQGARSGPECELLLMVNNDTEIVHPMWLSRLASWMDDPDVVGVGPKLVFPDGRIQHAGMVFGLGGVVGHYGLGMDELPSWGPPDLPREVSCLTGACLLVRAEEFHRLGALDETFEIDFQDVDLCIRLTRELGGQLVYDPTYPVVHHQMATRDPAEAGRDETVAQIRAKWGAVLEEPDPFWSPHLSLDPTGDLLREVPGTRIERQKRAAPRLRPTSSTA